MEQTRIFAIVFFEPNNNSRIEHKIYESQMKWFQKRFVREFISFSSKDLIHKMQIQENDQFVIPFGDDEFLVYVTTVSSDNCDLGCAMLIEPSHSHQPGRDSNLPHLYSKMLIRDYLHRGIAALPDNAEDIVKHFKLQDMHGELAETQKVLRRSISKVLIRGEEIEKLVDKTDTLSAQSKIFFKNSRDFNRCCFFFRRWW